MSLSTKISFDWERMLWKGITVPQVRLWESLYKDIDVIQELTVEMVKWLDKVKGTKKANKRNWKRFIVNWLESAQKEVLTGCRR